MAAWGLAPIPDLEDLTQLPEGEPDCLTGPDEPQPIDHAYVVVPISGGRSPWLGEQTLLLVEADGGGGQSGPSSHFADLHSARLPLDLQPELKLYGGPVPRRVLVQYFEGCPHWQTAAEHLARLNDEGLELSIDFELIDNNERAMERDFRGSPTVLIDGVDPFADENPPVGLACRVYRTEQGLAGSPTLSQLRRAIAAEPEE